MFPIGFSITKLSKLNGYLIPFGIYDSKYLLIYLTHPCFFSYDIDLFIVSSKQRCCLIDYLWILDLPTGIP